MRPQTVLVLGGTGFVGRHLCATLTGAGHAVRVLTRNTERARALRVLPGLAVTQGDPYDPRVLLREATGADAVVNLIGILNERGRSGAGFTRAHAELAGHVVAACGAARVGRLLHMSGLPAAADAPSHYLRSKAEAERRVRAAPSGVAWTIFRPSVIFGPGDSFMNRFAGLLKVLPMVPLARSHARLSPVYVGDVCAAFSRALDDPRTAGHSLDLCGPRTMTLAEVVCYVRDELGLARLVFGLPDWAGALQAGAMELLPGKPLSLDNFRSLGVDSVSLEDGLARLGIARTPIEAIVPSYLTAQCATPVRQAALRRLRTRE